MLACIVYGCINSALTSTDPELRYYNFPKNEIIAQKWIEATGWEKNHINLESAQMCSAHFAEDCYTREYKIIDFMPVYTKVLKSDAVPTLYVPTATLIFKNVENEADIETAEEIKQVILYVPAELTQNNNNTVPEETYLNIATQENDDPHLNLEYQLDDDSIDEKYKNKSQEALKDLEIENKDLEKKIKYLETSTKEYEKFINTKRNEYKEKLFEYRKLQQKFSKYRKQYMSTPEQIELLSKVFSESQIKILSGKKKIYWNNHDMAVGFTIRYLSNKRCYSHLTKNLKIPLPALSSIKRWTNLKRKRSVIQQQGDANKNSDQDSQEEEIKNDESQSINVQGTGNVSDEVFNS